MRNITIIIRKQLKDTLKNKTILIQFMLFPIMTLIMENAITLDGMPELFFTKLFSIMYIGMAPLTSVAAIIAEEKEKNTPRVLMMTNVKPWQYLTGVGLYVWLICMLGAGVMATGLDREAIVFYMCIVGIGFTISVVAGACIGIYVKNQMAATSVVMPVMLILAFLPMIATFNDKIEKVAKIFYTQQLKVCLENMAFADITKETTIVVTVNVLILIGLYGITYKRKGLE